MSLPVISIITITYNGEKHIEQTIQSVLGQTYPNIQYIIIDGGSTDQTLSIIKKYEQKLYYWVSEKDKGISDAFNKGIAKATGEIVGIINADDWYQPAALERVAARMGDADVCFGDLQLWQNEKKDYIKKGNLDLLNSEMSVNHPTVFIKKKVYDTCGAFNSEYRCAMDYDLMLRFKLAGCHFTYLPITLANMRWGGFSDNSWLLGCKETLEIKNKYLPGQSFRHRLYYLKHVAAIRAAKTFSHLGLGFIPVFYRKLFSRSLKPS